LNTSVFLSPSQQFLDSPRDALPHCNAVEFAASEKLVSALSGDDRSIGTVALHELTGSLASLPWCRG